MNGRRKAELPRVRVEVVTDRTAEIRGKGVHRVLERLQCPKQYQYRPPSGGRPCWTIPAQYARDVEAMAEHMGGSAEIDRQQVLQ